MDSLRQMYKIGPGPSSSHTMGPQKAAKIFQSKHPDIQSFQVELWGSLAATGKGHLTDYIIIETMKPAEVDIIWKPTYFHPYHSNGMKFMALDSSRHTVDEWIVFSIGGGDIRDESEQRYSTNEIYPLNKFTDIAQWCVDNDKELWEYVDYYEDEKIWDFLKEIWEAMLTTVERGLEKDGLLPGTINYPRKAKDFLEKSLEKQKENHYLETMVSNNIPYLGELYAYTLSAAEENGSGGTIVTAPTCGASGTIPGLLVFMYKRGNVTEERILKALAIGGLVGNIVKNNASISGAEAGCQAEVGVACAMGSAMASWLLGGSIYQIEYAAEMGLEHHLGMTCDPVGGYVQIPCIERNAMAAVRSLDTAKYSLFTTGKPNVPFDNIVRIMMETGKDLMIAYRETSEGGLAKYFGQDL